MDFCPFDLKEQFIWWETNHFCCVFLCLYFFAWCSFLTATGWEKMFLIGREEKWFKYLLKGGLLLSLEVERLMLKMSHLSTQKKCPLFHDQLLCSAWDFSVESSYATGRKYHVNWRQLLLWLVLTTSVHHHPLGCGFISCTEWLISIFLSPFHKNETHCVSFSSYKKGFMQGSVRKASPHPLSKSWCLYHWAWTSSSSTSQSWNTLAELLYELGLE